ncbi:MAG: type II toxin-antitoxin system RelE/ParE family toxin [Lachnospiraceae bacterium]|jgi:mRNA interferase RelE/StbE|nr:type II toxin-antitoxin system RelE/ParE family toxin [Lachnospiraceae bacterium]
MKINYSKQSAKFLSKQDKITQKRIIEAINKLPNGDVRKLQGRSGYRLRVGNFRVIFDREGNILHIEEIDNRGQVYK